MQKQCHPFAVILNPIVYSQKRKKDINYKHTNSNMEEKYV